MKIDNLMENSFVTGLEGGLGPQAFMYPSVVEMHLEHEVSGFVKRNLCKG